MMKIKYYQDSNGNKVTKDISGKEEIIPKIYFEYFQVDGLHNGTGTIDIPDILIKLIKDKTIQFKGTTDKELPKMDDKGNINTTLPASGPIGFTTQNGFGIAPGREEFAKGELDRKLTDPAAASKFRQQPFGGQLNDINFPNHGYAGKHAKHYPYGLNVKFDYDQAILNSLSTEILETAYNKFLAELKKRKSFFAPTMSLENNVKQALIALGFKEKTDGRWYHHILGEDREDNWLKFDPKTDSLTKITTMLFGSGFIKGQFKVRMDIKKALDI